MKNVEETDALVVDLTEANEALIELETPIFRGKTQINQIIIRKPRSGALRGLRLQALAQSDVDSMMMVLPRVSTPSLSPQELMEMDPVDFLALCSEVIGFLLPTSAKSDSLQT